MEHETGTTLEPTWTLCPWFLPAEKAICKASTPVTAQRSSTRVAGTNDKEFSLGITDGTGLPGARPLLLSQLAQNKRLASDPPSSLPAPGQDAEKRKANGKMSAHSSPKRSVLPITFQTIIPCRKGGSGLHKVIWTDKRRMELRQAYGFGNDANVPKPSGEGDAGEGEAQQGNNLMSHWQLSGRTHLKSLRAPRVAGGEPRPLSQLRCLAQSTQQ